MSKSLRAKHKQKKFRIIFALLIVVVLLVGVYTFVPIIAPKPTPDILQVVRPKNPLRPNIPVFEKRITDAAAVQRLYNAALALPGIKPFATYNCAMDDGEIYTLTFLNGSTKIKTMELDASGCEWLRIDTGNIFHPQDIRQAALGKIDFYGLFSHTIGYVVLVAVAQKEA